MRIAMMQMAMTEDMERNLQVIYEAVKEAAGADLLFFPEVQHMPFLPQYTADELPDYLLDPDDPRVTAFYDLARQAHCMCRLISICNIGGRPMIRQRKCGCFPANGGQNR